MASQVSAVVVSSAAVAVVKPEVSPGRASQGWSRVPEMAARSLRWTWDLTQIMSVRSPCGPQLPL